MSDEEPIADAEPVSDAPDGEEEMFPRSYVEELRQEAAARRTQLREYEQAFEDYAPSEKEALLDLATKLANDPQAALPEFERITNTLKEEFGTVPDITPAKDPEVKAPDTSAEGGITKDQLEAWYKERREAEKAESANEAQVRSVFQEAEALNPAYKEGSDALVQLLHVAQHDEEAGGTLKGAHEVLLKRVAEIETKAIQEYRDGLRAGSSHPPVTSTGASTTGEAAEPPKTLEEASRRAQERLRAAGMG